MLCFPCSIVLMDLRPKFVATATSTCLRVLAAQIEQDSADCLFEGHRIRSLGFRHLLMVEIDGRFGRHYSAYINWHYSAYSRPRAGAE